MAKHRSVSHRESLRRSMSRSRQALNRRMIDQPLPFVGAMSIDRPHDPATFPPQRTAIESKARDAAFLVYRWFRTLDGIERTDFYAGADNLDRAVLVATGCPDRARVFRRSTLGAIGETAAETVLFDNQKSIAERPQ